MMNVSDQKTGNYTVQDGAIDLYRAPSARPGQREINLQDIPSIAWRRRLIVLSTILAISIPSVLWYIVAPKHWKTEADIAFIQRQTGDYPADESFSAPLVETVDTQLSMLASPEMASRAVLWLQNDAVDRGLSADSVTITPEKMQSAITTTNPKDTNLIEVSVDARSPLDAVRYANAVTEAFVDWKQELARKDAGSAVDDLKNQASMSKAALQQAESNLLNVEQRSEMTDPGDKERSVLGQQDAISSELALAQADSMSAIARRDGLEKTLSTLNSSLENASEVRDDSLTESLQEQLRQLQAAKVAAAQKFTSAYPGMLTGYDKQIESLNKQLSESIRRSVNQKDPSLGLQAIVLQQYEQAQSDAQFAAAKLNAAEQSMHSVHEAVSNLPTTELDVTRAQRDVEIASTAYSTIESDLTNASLALNSTPPNVMITQAALTPTEPTAPQRSTFLLLIPLASLLLGVFLATQRESNSPSLHTIRELNDLGIGPVISALPRNAFDKRMTLVSPTQPTAVAEAFSIARTNLNSFMRQTSSDTSGGKVILVSSTASGEGKSISAALLSLSYIRAGKTVTLVDANLRTPSINELLEIEPYPGFSDVLLGKVSLAHAIVTSNELVGLTILTSGTPVHGSADLLALDTLPIVIEKLRSMSDVVIIDTPSCEYADMFALAGYADCTVMVVDFDKVDSDVLSHASNAIRSQGSPRIALLANNYQKTPSKAFSFSGLSMGSGQFALALPLNGTPSGLPVNRVIDPNGVNFKNAIASHIDERQFGFATPDISGQQGSDHIISQSSGSGSNNPQEAGIVPENDLPTSSEVMSK